MTMKRISGEQYRKEREAIGAKNLSVFAAICEVSAPALCKWEKGVYNFSARSLDRVMRTLEEMKMVASRHPGVSINFADVGWLRSEIAAIRNQSRMRTRASSATAGSGQAAAGR